MTTIHAGEFNANAATITPPVTSPQVGDTMEILLAKLLTLLAAQYGL